MLRVPAEGGFALRAAGDVFVASFNASLAIAHIPHIRCWETHKHTHTDAESGKECLRLHHCILPGPRSLRLVGGADTSLHLHDLSSAGTVVGAAVVDSLQPHTQPFCEGDVNGVVVVREDVGFGVEAGFETGRV